VHQVEDQTKVIQDARSTNYQGRIKIVSKTERLPGQSSLNLQIKTTVKCNKKREITHCSFFNFNFNFNLMFKLQIFTNK
jgi:hypothetical protein